MVCEFGGNERRLCANDLCQVCWSKSMASHRLSSMIDAQTARAAMKSSVKKIQWHCFVCNHEFWKSQLLVMALAHPKNNGPIVVLQRSKSCVYNSAYVCNVQECGMECVLW
jgi:hypothetical protein